MHLALLLTVSPSCSPSTLILRMPLAPPLLPCSLACLLPCSLLMHLFPSLLMHMLSQTATRSILTCIFPLSLTLYYLFASEHILSL